MYPKQQVGFSARNRWEERTASWVAPGVLDDVPGLARGDQADRVVAARRVAGEHVYAVRHPAVVVVDLHSQARGQDQF